MSRTYFPAAGASVCCADAGRLHALGAGVPGRASGSRTTTAISVAAAAGPGAAGAGDGATCRAGPLIRRRPLRRLTGPRAWLRLRPRRRPRRRWRRLSPTDSTEPSARQCPRRDQGRIGRGGWQANRHLGRAGFQRGVVARDHRKRQGTDCAEPGGVCRGPAEGPAGSGRAIPGRTSWNLRWRPTMRRACSCTSASGSERAQREFGLREVCLARSGAAGFPGQGRPGPRPDGR